MIMFWTSRRCGFEIIWANRAPRQKQQLIYVKALALKDLAMLRNEFYPTMSIIYDNPRLHA